jgi:aspartyl-tRNA(Asn)/glutamyl-tRNA(Gln) amidotransferase subunit A
MVALRAHEQSAVGIAEMVRTAARPATAVVREHLDRIEKTNAALGALREIYADEAIAAAEVLDSRVAAGEDVGPLAGVPLVIKDNICATLGTTACGSRMLEGYRSPFTATAVERLLKAGAIIIGRANCDEFAMGSSSEHCAFGVVRNPHDQARVPGGSSGGSAAAVAAGMCAVALGSETGGSVRQPASFCGVVGIKPSYGRISRSGLVAFGSSLDQIGPLANTVADAALALQIMSGVDPLDSTSSSEPTPETSSLSTPIENLRIGVPREHLSASNDVRVNEAIREAIGAFRSHGAEVIEVDLPLTRYGNATYYVIATAEASSNLARFDGVRYGHRSTLASGESLENLYVRSRSEGFGVEVQRRIMLGTYALSAGYYEAYYRRAAQVRRLITQEYDRAFVKCDALIGPVAPTPAFEIGAKADPLSMYLCDAYTVNANVAGICAMSVPCAASPLPIGLQIQCPAFAEANMLRIARMYERSH